MTYQAMAKVYDQLMLHVDYDKWVDGLEYQWRKQDAMPQRVLDAGCGTGSVLLPLAKRKYQMVGIDLSPEMLSVCQDKLFQENLSAILMEMDIRQIKLPEKTDAVVCLCDTLNYLTKEKDLEQCFKSVHRALNQGGCFIFDMHTPYYYHDVLADSQWVEQEEDVVLIWENDFSQKPIIDIDLTFFVKQKNGLFRKYVEEHQQRCYQIELVKELVEKSGLTIKYVGSDLFGRQLDLTQDERMYFLALKG